MKALSVLAGFVTGSAVMAASVVMADERPCFDAVVYARAVKQLPTDLPSIDDGSIVMSWPCFVDLDVKRLSKAIRARAS